MMTWCLRHKHENESGHPRQSGAAAGAGGKARKSFWLQTEAPQWPEQPGGNASLPFPITATMLKAIFSPVCGSQILSLLSFCCHPQWTDYTKTICKPPSCMKPWLEHLLFLCPLWALAWGRFHFHTEEHPEQQVLHQTPKHKIICFVIVIALMPLLQIWEVCSVAPYCCSAVNSVFF